MTTSTFLGSDTDALADLARRLGEGAAVLEATGSRTGTGLHHLAWRGPDARACRSRWEVQVAPSLTAVAAALRRAGNLLSAEAAEQVAASSDGGASGAAGAVPGSGARASGAGGAVGPPPQRGGPTATAQWWRSLTEEQRHAVIADHPEWIGAADGIPAHARDQANRALLVRTDDALQARVDQLRARIHDLRLRTPRDGAGLTAELYQQLGRTQDKLDGVHALQDLLARADAAGQPRQLLLLDATSADQLLAAVAVGDVDSADHVAVLTPGFTTTVATRIDGYDADMAHLRTAALEQLQAVGRQESVAAVAWLGYEAPQVNTTLTFGKSVAGSALAQQGGQQLSAFLTGINAARTDDPHLTVLAHSYGSTTAGYALQRASGVDDAVFFGSPGIATDDASTLHLSGTAYAMEADWDGVAALGRFGPDPSSVPGLTHLSTDAATVHGVAYTDVSGHTSYLTPGSTSMHNLTSVVVGRPEAAVPGQNLGPGDALRAAGGAAWRAAVEAWKRGAPVPPW